MLLLPFIVDFIFRGKESGFFFSFQGKIFGIFFSLKGKFCTDRRCIASAPMSVNKRRGPGWFTGMGALLWAMQAVME